MIIKKLIFINVVSRIFKGSDYSNKKFVQPGLKLKESVNSR